MLQTNHPSKIIFFTKVYFPFLLYVIVLRLGSRGNRFHVLLFSSDTISSLSQEFPSSLLYECPVPQLLLDKQLLFRFYKSHVPTFSEFSSKAIYLGRICYVTLVHDLNFSIYSLSKTSFWIHFGISVETALVFVCSWVPLLYQFSFHAVRDLLVEMVNDSEYEMMYKQPLPQIL